MSISRYASVTVSEAFKLSNVTAYLGQLVKVDGFLGAGKTCRTLQRVQTRGSEAEGPDVAMGAGAGSPAELHCYCALYATNLAK